MTEPVLQVRSLCKRFGGLAAVDNVSLELEPGELHAVIGPNGAGKTTLINLLSGDLPVSSGGIVFRGEDITRLAPEQRSRRGLARSYQKVNIFPEFSVAENCRLAAQSREPHAFNWVRRANAYRSINMRAEQALAAVGLDSRAAAIAGQLSHGEQRQLEIAMSLATEPHALLLDEPLAGMGLEESQAMVALLARLGETHALLLIEHDMDAVFALARVLTVMVNGAVLASGAPAEVRANDEVQRAYLGSDHG